MSWSHDPSQEFPFVTIRDVIDHPLQFKGMLYVPCSQGYLAVVSSIKNG